jgi:dipeptidyl aminopeptidase/acylaminoacyl peptidase
MCRFRPIVAFAAIALLPAAIVLPFANPRLAAAQGETPRPWLIFACGSAIYRVDDTGRNPQLVVTLTLPSAADYGYELRKLSWSPDGRWFAIWAMPQLQRPGYESYGHLVVVRADGSQTYRLPGAIPLAWAPSGRLLVRKVLGETLAELKTEYAWFLPDDNVEKKVAFELGGPAAVSPDGQWIALVAFGNDSRSDDIFRVRLDGSGLEQLTHSPGREDAPRWSPDGKSIVFSYQYENKLNLHRMAADGSQRQQLTDGTNDLNPAWSPDGQTLAFIAYREGHGYDLFRVQAGGSQRQRLSSELSVKDDAQPSWSPDGKRLAFDAWSDGVLDVYVIDADGSRLVKVAMGSSFNGLDKAWPVWSPVLR